MQKNSQKANWIVRIGCIILCLTMFSSSLLSNMFARYATSDIGNDVAIIADFKINSDFLQNGKSVQKINISIEPTDPEVNYKVVVENESDVDVKYTVEIENVTKNLPLHITLNDSEALRISDELAANINNRKEYDVSFSWEKESDENNFIYYREIDYITATIYCEQID